MLELDIGNSFVKWRCGQECGQLPTATLSPAELELAWRCLAPRRMRVASVAGIELEVELAAFARSHWGVEVEVAKTLATAAGVTNSYTDPSRMGVDRWLAMLAGFHAAEGGCCVVDCGSAITIDYVADDGYHQGGYIMPGLRLMREGLFANTSRVRVDSESIAALTTPGRSTAEAVDHGVHLMLAALAERIDKDAALLLGAAAPLYVTGGDGAAFAAFVPRAEWVPELVLDGLAYALP